VTNIPEIALVDDEQAVLNILSSLIGEYYTNEAQFHAAPPFRNLHTFNSASAVLAYFASGKTIDVAILDIFMPEFTGIEIARRLRENGFNGYIIFLTSANDFASESYAVGAFSYILKPVEKEKIFFLMQKIEAAFVQARSEDTAAVLIQTKQYNKNVLFGELVFVEVIGRKLYLHLADKEILSINRTLREFAPALLVDDRFTYCHNSIIVNMDFVETIKNNVAVLKTGQSIPISRRHSDFKSRYIARSIRKISGTEG
jgi:DNA-binding LytR/AlgR family response regulator